MKTKTIATIGALGSLLVGAVQAGDMSGSAAYAGGAGAGGAGGGGIGHAGSGLGVGGLLEELGGSLSAGYDSDYYWRGQHLGGQPIWTGLDIGVPLTEGFDLDLGAWYINPTDSGVHNDELDLYASTGISLGDIDATIGVIQYTFPELSDDGSTELNLGFELNPLDLLNVGVGFHYDLDFETLYGELTTGTSYELADGIAADLGLTFGYLLDEGDTGGDTDWTHLLVSAGLPIALSDNAALTPYVAYNIQGDRFEQGGGDADDDLFGGVSLSVDF